MSSLNKRYFTDWKKIINLYINWVSKTKLRYFFANNLLYENLSVWWISDICNKDNVIKNKWFLDLKLLLIDKKKIKNNLIVLYIKFLILFFKNFCVTFIWYSILKFISFTRFCKINRKNCFHSFNYNFFNYNNTYLDRMYRNSVLSNKSQNFYLVNIIKKREFLINKFFKKNNSKKIPALIADEYISPLDVIVVYLKTLMMFLKLNLFLIKSKDIFFLNKKNCEEVLKPLLLLSFAGGIQTSILIGKSIYKSLEKKNTKMFINYVEFNPYMRSVYFYLRNLKNSPKIITIQHGGANRNLLFFLHKKNEFTLSSKKEGQMFSPSPDIYFVKGRYFKNILQSYFLKPIHIIGSLNHEKPKSNLITSLRKKILRTKSKGKKYLLLCPSIGDENLILSFFENCDHSNYSIILSPHPTHKKKIIKNYFEKLNNKFEIKTFDNYSTNELILISDLVVYSMSTVGYEALFSNVMSVRLINKSVPPFFNTEDKLPIIDNYTDFNDLMSGKLNLKLKKNEFIKLKEYYFYKIDNNVHRRFWLSLNKIGK